MASHLLTPACARTLACAHTHADKHAAWRSFGSPPFHQPDMSDMSDRAALTASAIE
jgi:hypothetical protein